MNTAVIDIGSNSVRLMWDKVGKLHPKHIITTQLSEGLDASGFLNLAAMTRTVTAIQELCEKARSRGAKNVVAFATEAVRASSNGAEFCRMVEQRSGLRIDVLDGVTEAQCGFFGAKEDVSGRVAVLDIGGASLEIIVGNSTPEYARSLPLGAVRMKERYGGDYVRFRESLGVLLEDFGTVPAFDRLVAIGGTPTTVVAMVRGFARYDPIKVHGATVLASEVKQAEQLVTTLSTAELMQKCPTLVRARAEVIPYGTMLLGGVLKRFNLTDFVVSEKDNLEGYVTLRHLD